jgi:hypothetical protein
VGCTATCEHGALTFLYLQVKISALKASGNASWRGRIVAGAEQQPYLNKENEMKKSNEVIAVEDEAVMIIESFAKSYGKKEIDMREIPVMGWLVIVGYSDGKGVAHAMEKVGA